MDKVDQQYLEEMVKAQGEDVPSSAYDIKFQDDGLTLDELIKMSEGIRKGDEALDSRVTLSYIKVSTNRLSLYQVVLMISISR